jgi:tetratricopeptide (TPR) repeat protein
MAYRVASVLMCLVSMSSASGAEAGLSRGELFQDWRQRLESAAQAVHRGDDEQAVALFGSILNEAETRGEEGLLVARAADGLADLYREQHHFDLAAPYYVRSAELWKRLLGDSQPRRAVTLHNLGICYVELADWPAAERVLRDALTVWRDAGESVVRIRETEKVLEAALAHRSIPWKNAPR